MIFGIEAEDGGEGYEGSEVEAGRVGGLVGEDHADGGFPGIEFVGKGRLVEGRVVVAVGGEDGLVYGAVFAVDLGPQQ